MGENKAKVVFLSTANNDFQRFEVLKRNRNKRHAYREFFVEGVRNINGAIANNFEIKSYIYNNEIKLSDWAINILQSDKTTTRYELTPDLMERISDKEDTSELVAIAAMPANDLTGISLSANPFLMIFDRPANKGNLGSIIRSCDAFGADALVITGHAVDLYDPETIRASMGSFFKLPVARVPSFNDIKSWLLGLKEKYRKIQFIGTSEKGHRDLDKCNFAGPVALFIGNESEGLSFNYEQISDALVRIHMSENSSASSLNVSNAAAIFLYEISRQRRNIKDLTSVSSKQQ
jgi:tRNA G18 (ribose-2'-O)-methylase SpoU